MLVWLISMRPLLKGYLTSGNAISDGGVGQSHNGLLREDSHMES